MARKKPSIKDGLVSLTCCVTGEQKESPGFNEDGQPKLPRGWKRLQGKVYSPKGFKNSFVTRSICLPVTAASVIDDPKHYQTPEGDHWNFFRDNLRVLWRETCQLMNWTVRQLAALDTKPVVGGVLHKLDYNINTIRAEASSLFTQLDSQSRNEIIRRTIGYYEADRFDYHIRGSKSVKSFRDNPQPLPLVKDCINLAIDGQDITVSPRLAGLLPCLKFRLTLGADIKDFGRNMDLYRRCAAGELEHGWMTISQNRRGKIIVRLAIHLPKQISPKDDHAVMLIRTDPSRLLIGEMRGRHVFELANENLFCRHARHLAWLAGMGTDRKAERRGLGDYHTDSDDSKTRKRKRRQHKRNFERKVQSRCASHEDFMTDQLHKASATVVNHAVRRGVFAVRYDDTCRERADKFPWARLRELIRGKLVARGIVVEADENSEETD